MDGTGVGIWAGDMHDLREQWRMGAGGGSYGYFASDYGYGWGRAERHQSVAEQAGLLGGQGCAQIGEAVLAWAFLFGAK